MTQITPWSIVEKCHLSLCHSRKKWLNLLLFSSKLLYNHCKQCFQQKIKGYLVSYVEAAMPSESYIEGDDYDDTFTLIDLICHIDHSLMLFV